MASVSPRLVRGHIHVLKSLSQTTAVATLLPSGFAVSSRAEAVLGGSGDNRWLTIVYPDYGGARLHLTFTVSDVPTLCRRTALSGSL